MIPDLDCGDHSFYNPQMSLDVSTCQNPDGFHEVSMGVGEGCQCVPGFILNSDKCVSFDDCGCTLPGEDQIYIQVRNFTLAIQIFSNSYFHEIMTFIKINQKKYCSHYFSINQTYMFDVNVYYFSTIYG